MHKCEFIVEQDWVYRLRFCINCIMKLEALKKSAEMQNPMSGIMGLWECGIDVVDA